MSNRRKRVFNAVDWYWVRDDGVVFSSYARAIIANPDRDQRYQAWLEVSGPATKWPRDDAGNQTDTALREVLTPYGVSFGA